MQNLKIADNQWRNYLKSALCIVIISGGIKHPKAVLDSGQQGDAGLCHEGEEVPHLRELHGHHHLGDLQGRLRIGQRLSALNLLVLALIIIRMELSEHNIQHK